MTYEPNISPLPDNTVRANEAEKDAKRVVVIKPEHFTLEGEEYFMDLVLPMLSQNRIDVEFDKELLNVEDKEAVRNVRLHWKHEEGVNTHSKFLMVVDCTDARAAGVDIRIAYGSSKLYVKYTSSMAYLELHRVGSQFQFNAYFRSGTFGTANDYKEKYYPDFS